MSGQVRGCEHGVRPTACWDCLPVMDQIESRRVWVDLEKVPGFSVTVEQAEIEAREGKILPLRRADYGERRIVIPHSALWEIVDLIMDDDDDA